MAKSLVKKQAKPDQDKTVHEQQTESVALVEANANANLYADNREINEMLTRAASYGELLEQDYDYARDAAEIVKAKEVDDYKAIAMLKHLDCVLSNDQRALLPWPMRTKSEAEAKRTAGSNEPLLFDKPAASGGRAKVETFYGNMIKHTKLGKEAIDTIEKLEKEIAQAKVEPSKARAPANIEADMKRANRQLNNLLSALRTAAQVRLMIEDIKMRCPNVVIEWIREIDDNAEIPDDADLTMLNVWQAGNVVHSPLCLNIWTKPQNPQLMAQAMSRAKRYSIGTFKRWKVDKAIEIANRDKRSRVTVDDLISSAKADVDKPAKTPTVSNVRDVNSWTQLVENVEAVLRYWNDDPTKASARHAEFVGSMAATDDTLDSMYQLYITLRARFEGDPSLAKRAIEVHEKLNAA